MYATSDEVVTILQDGREIRTETALVSVGRVACTGDLNLERIGVTLNPNGYIPIDEYCRTSVGHIYAVGDVSKLADDIDLSLVHVTEAEG
ncbi:MAG: FAD-dependent oxidoreductase, partial [Candidatus Marinimicrobia bacterium]|nr:FAD-dependent oxidoreductase [Candidatus Neomarinimicrobiota bacterium]